MRVTSKYGEDRGDSNHRGIDLAGLKAGTAEGMKIPALVGGTVTTVFKNNKTAGNGVVIKGSDGREYRYIHMKNTPSLKVGQKVNAGANLGLVGNTGSSHGAHLDLKIKDSKGNYIDPMKVLNALSKQSSKDTGKKATNPSTYKNTWKIDKEALKSPGYQTYKKHLSQALQTGQIKEEWVVPLTELIGRESSWNPKADNKKSSAWGYGQFLNDTRALYKQKYPKLDYNDPVDQIILTAKYVQSRYGTPEKALQHWDKNKWY